MRPSAVFWQTLLKYFISACASWLGFFSPCCLDLYLVLPGKSETDFQKKTTFRNLLLRTWFSLPFNCSFPAISGPIIKSPWSKLKGTSQRTMKMYSAQGLVLKISLKKYLSFRIRRESTMKQACVKMSWQSKSIILSVISFPLDYFFSSNCSWLLFT